MSDDVRQELRGIRADLEAEEVEQVAERGYASPKLLRAIARLDRLVGHADNVIALTDVTSVSNPDSEAPP